MTDITISREKIQNNENIIDLEGMNKISNSDFDSSILYSIDHFEDDYFKEDKILSCARYMINEDPCELEDLKETLHYIEDSISSRANNDIDININDDNNNNNDDNDNDDGDLDDFIKIYPGNFFIACPSIIDSVETSNISACWIIKKDKVLYQANIKFDAYLDTKKKGIKKYNDITQPLLSTFYVDEIKWK